MLMSVLWFLHRMCPQSGRNLRLQSRGPRPRGLPGGRGHKAGHLYPGSRTAVVVSKLEGGRVAGQGPESFSGVALRGAGRVFLFQEGRVCVCVCVCKACGVCVCIRHVCMVCFVCARRVCVVCVCLCGMCLCVACVCKVCVWYMVCVWCVHGMCLCVCVSVCVCKACGGGVCVCVCERETACESPCCRPGPGSLRLHSSPQPSFQLLNRGAPERRQIPALPLG